MDHHRALRHYQTAIRALTDGQYGDLTESESRALIRVLKEERQKLLDQMVADRNAKDNAGPARPAKTPSSPSSR